MERGPLGYIFKVVPNQVLDTYYDPDNITRKGYNLAWLTRLRISALVHADLLSAFALFEVMNYLTDVWNLSTAHAAGIINLFGGISATLVIVFSFLADSILGDLNTLALSSIAYSIGLGLLSLSTPTFFGLCNDYKEECIGYTQKIMFYTALSLIAVGMAGHFVTLPSFIMIEHDAQPQAKPQVHAQPESQVHAQAEPQVHAQPEQQVHAQQEVELEGQPEPEISQIGDFVILVIVIVCGGIVPSYAKAYSVRFGVPAICTLTATLLFLTGFPRYQDNKHESPLKIALRVFTAAASKDFQQVEMYTKTYEEYKDEAIPTNTLRWLDKAATKFPDQKSEKSWTLCSIREIEDTKTGIRTVPMLLTLLVTGLVLSLVNTYFLAQANHMDRKLGSIKIQIPFLLLLYTLFSNMSQLVHTYAFKVTCLPSMYFAKIEIGIGMLLSVLCCIIAAIVENHRLRRAVENSSQMSVFFLIPQIALLGFVDGILYFGIKRYLQDQNVTELRQTYLLYLRKFVLGLGSMASVLFVHVVGKLSESNNRSNWFQHTLNESRLDRYYWTLAGLSAVNLVIYAIVASLDKYKEISKDEKAKKCYA